MSLPDGIPYRIGYTPWERLAELPAGDQSLQLFAGVEVGRRPPFGTALDLGCGSGIWSVAIARRGWDVTGVYLVPQALDRARRRAAEAGVALRLVNGEVSRLEDAGVGGSFGSLYSMT